MRAWNLGNTTVRSPLRLRDALIMLVNSPLVGRIEGRENETAFAMALHNAGVLNIHRPEEDVSDMGRKWRSAMTQLGFIYPKIPPREGIPQTDLGDAYTITPNGRRLIDTETVAGMQECFLRSLAAYYIPSVLERGYPVAAFSPLRHTLAVLLELERRTRESRLNFIEMSLFVQLTSSDNPLAGIVDGILAFRAARIASPRKRLFDTEALAAAAVEHGYVPGTFRDYADCNIRYLKATGLVQSKGRGIAIVPQKRVFVEQLVADTAIPANDRLILFALCNGATLPTDNRATAMVVLNDLVVQVNRRGVPFDLAGRVLTDPADIAIIRHEIEDILSRLDEDEYAARQAAEWTEIVEYMDLLITPRRIHAVGDDAPIQIPQTEGPAYFEWVLWRAFLAIDSLVNRPYESRRFKIDQDFLPVGTAPGGGPDVIFEFEHFVVVVEVTLTDNSRQEAAEGEPVRRHVADLMVHHAALTGKPVYGLFVAKKIDSNTAETFRIGVWYAQDDTRMDLDIVPFTLVQFKSLFEAMFQSGNVDAAHLRELFDLCSGTRTDHHAPAWKAAIARTVQAKVDALNVAA